MLARPESRCGFEANAQAAGYNLPGAAQAKQSRGAAGAKRPPTEVRPAGISLFNEVRAFEVPKAVLVNGLHFL